MDKIDEIIENIHDVLVDAEVEEPAGRGAGWKITFDEGFMRTVLEKLMPPGFVWINKPAIVSGEDFTYRAQVLCSFPKTSGKVRYIVEDNGRIFVQRESQIKFIDDDPSVEEQLGIDMNSGDKKLKGACPHCGYRHPPDGMCV